MQRTTSKHVDDQADLRQHFHNYFEFLLGEERYKLQQAIGKECSQTDRQEVLVEIECRISYLRGAVRMGKLLCLIDQEEAKANFDALSAERESLRATAIGEKKIVQRVPERQTTAARFASIRSALQA